ncbi:hypothetical protein EWM64_g422 [Hericium alpestre]|uniref:Peroxisomal membrane protein PEX14 n=1 Tax=Hericium alpestre TaxID=135208 RepID=A0A4Z0ACU7_9AGAM|nr:hypothetical protein EWM64_g422 [Hericium alpestre]
MASDRADLLNNAVAFLTDPKTQSSPLAQRVQFLEAKGLTAPEIEHAMRQAAAHNNSTAPMQAYQSPRHDLLISSQITAVVSGSIAYGAISLARKYLVPHLRPPTSTAYEEDRDALTAQFDAAEALLKEIQADTAAVKAAVQEQHEKVEKATSDVVAAVKEMRDGQMFSQFRHVVEGLAQPQPRSSQDASPTSDHPGSPARSPSLDAHSLRESLSSTSLLKSLVSQRPASPSPSNGSNDHQRSSSTSRPKGRLEDRLRASFAIGDASNGNSPSASTRVSPSPVSVTEHPLSPSAVPLPQSPPPQGIPEPISLSLSLSPPPHPLSPPEVPLITQSPPTPEATGEGAEQTLDTNTFLNTSPSASSEEENQPRDDPSSTAHDVELDSLPAADSSEAEIEALVGDSEESQSDSQKAASDDALSPPAESVDSAEQSSQGREGLMKEETEAAKQEAELEEGKSGEEKAEEKEASEPHDDKKKDESPPVHTGSDDGIVAEATVSPHEGESEGDTSDAPAGEVTASNEAVPSPEDVSVPEEVVQIKERDGISDNEVEGLRDRLKLVEQRFSDVSTSFKRLQAEKLAADKVLQELTPVQSLKDSEGLRDYLQNFTLKVEISQDEIRRLTGKLTRQEELIEELRETHHLESRSSSELIDQVRAQLSQAEALLDASRTSTTQLEAELAQQKLEMERLHAEVNKAKGAAKDEEEKRTKAISLLKTVRQKLVKAEKERDEALAEAKAIKENEKAERERERVERVRLQGEVDKMRSEKETAIANLKALHEREITAQRERDERDRSALRAQLELDAVTTKAAHDHVVNTLNSRITGFQQTVQTLSAEKDSLFDQLQLRQAELESSQTHLEVLQSQNTELQYQLRETNDRIGLLTEELADARREQETKPHGPSTSAEEIAKLLSAAETRYEAKLSDLRRKLATAEGERDETQAEWSRKLDGKVKEAERWKAEVESFSTSQQSQEAVVNELREELERMKNDIRSYTDQISQLQRQAAQASEIEAQAQQNEAQWNAKISLLEQAAEEAKARESQARAHNKTLREELRKVQSSAALLERQRNPGVGYWGAARAEAPVDDQTPTSPPSSASNLPSRVGSPRPGTPSQLGNDEDVNLEYLRNVILQFLEHKEMRSGVSASKWSDLCRLFISKQPYYEAEDAERAVSNSVLVLFGSYPGDPALHAYITCALQKGFLSLNIFAATFLQAARSPELHNPATLELLCRTAVETSLSSNIPSLGSIISESPDAALSTIGDALALLQTVYNLPVMSGRLSELVGNLLLLMLHSFTDLAKVSSAQAMACIDDAKVTLLFQLSPDVRQALENFVVSLSFFADEDPTVTREVKMIHTMQSSLAKGDILGPGVGGHDVSCALLLYHLGQALWLRKRFIRDVHDDGYVPINVLATGQILFPEEDCVEGLHPRTSVGLLDQMFAIKVDATLANETASRIQMEAREAGTDIESFIGTKLSPDSNAEDTTAFLERIYDDFACHPVFASVVRKRFETLAASYEIDGLGHLAKILYLNDTALDILSLHIPLSGLLSRSVALIDSYDCESVGDPQTAVSHLGDVVLFLQSTAARYKLPLSTPSGGAAPDFLQRLDTIYRSDELTAEQVLACDAWSKAIFDKGSEGIEDGILSILRLLSDPSLQRFVPKDFDVSSVRDAVNHALSLPDRGTADDTLAMPAFVHWQDQPRHAVQDALESIRSGKPPILDVAQCIHVVPPTRFLQLFWDEISMALSLGANIDALRHFAVFILAAPRTPGTPPLLPIFLHNVAPALMGVVDRQPAATQSMNAELLVAVLSSSIMFAHHLERAMPAAHAEQEHALGEASSAMASRLATDLRHRKHGTTAKHIAHRLASSSTFVANFPAFKTEI